MTWKVDNSHTAIEFSARHMMVSTVRGNFNRFQGELELDLENPSRSRARAEIEATSLDTREERRDAHLRSADFFDVERFPTITYESRKIESLGQDRYRVSGELTIKDVTHPLTLEVQHLGQGRNPMGQEVVGFEARGTLSRKDWGLTWNVGLETGGWLVGDEIQIRIDAEAVRQADEERAQQEQVA